jgi:hypothetical protein
MTFTQLLRRATYTLKWTVSFTTRYRDVLPFEIFMCEVLFCDVFVEVFY